MILTTAAIVVQTPLQDARAWFTALQQGRMANPGELNAQMKDAMTPAALSQMAALLKDTGSPKSFEQVQTSAVQSLTIYVFKITFANAPALDFIYSLDDGGKIAGLRFSPTD